MDMTLGWRHSTVCLRARADATSGIVEGGGSTSLLASKMRVRACKILQHHVFEFPQHCNGLTFYLI